MIDKAHEELARSLADYNIGYRDAMNQIKTILDDIDEFLNPKDMMVYVKKATIKKDEGDGDGEERE